LLLRFHGARASDEGNLIAADDHIAGRRRNPQDAVFLLSVAADQFVRLADRNALDNAREGFEDAEIDRALVAGDADGRADGPRHGVGLQAEAFNALADFADLLLGGCVCMTTSMNGSPPQCVTFEFTAAQLDAANADGPDSWPPLDFD